MNLIAAFVVECIGKWSHIKLALHQVEVKDLVWERADDFLLKGCDAADLLNAIQNKTAGPGVYSGWSIA